jgi:hypothetical protein
MCRYIPDLLNEDEPQRGRDGITCTSPGRDAWGGIADAAQRAIFKIRNAHHECGYP